MQRLIEKAKVMALDVLPASVSPENQYAKSFAAVLTLAVSADFTFDRDEFAQASIFIERDVFLRNNSLTRRAIDYFKAYCDDIKSVMKEDNIDFPAVQTELIAEVRNVPSEYRQQLGHMIQTLLPVCSTQEQEVLRRIEL